MINLFFVIHDHSGARTYASELLGYLTTQNETIIHKVYLHSVDYKEYTQIEEGGILNIHIPEIKGKGNTLGKYAARCIDLIEPLLRDKSNIIFHLNYCTQIKFGILARNRFGAKLIYTLHFLPDIFSYFGYDDDWQVNRKITVDVLEHEVVRESDRVICVTRFAKKAICHFYKTPVQKVEAIHNGFSSIPIGLNSDREPKEKIVKTFGFRENEKIILFVGLIEPRKGLNILLSAFNQLVGKFANARLVIAGDGNFKNALEQIKCNWGKVTFTGNIPYSELEKLYQIATIGIIPSIYEQCSYVALEMMKFGLPVVVTAVPGLRELYINGENALVLPLHKSNNIKMRLEYNEDQITVALSTLLGDKDLLHKISKNARVNWELYYTAARMGDATISQYKKLLIQTRNESTTRDNEFYQ